MNNKQSARSGLLLTVVLALYACQNNQSDAADSANNISLNTQHSGDASTGALVYQSTCAACHDQGLVNAPKLTDKLAWEKRSIKGLKALFHTVKSGKGAMPPSGGNAALTDEQLTQAVLFMTLQAGISIADTHDTPSKAKP